MHLPRPFFRLARRFDVAQLRAELASLPAEAWAAHPNDIPGNSSVRLISADGGENDRVEGEMCPTATLARLPYVRQVLGSFGVAWSRTRLLRLAPGAVVPEHADINYHWFYRVRLHIPIATRPEVQFHCGDMSVHMAAGEAWVFDNWRLHRVENPTPDERVHLVADTVGNAAFWHLVASSDDPGEPVTAVPYVAGREARILTERAGLRPVMNPAEVELLVGNLRGELAAADPRADARLSLTRYHALLDAFVRDWRQLYVLHGEEPAGRAEFLRLRDSLRTASRAVGEGLVTATNGVGAHQVLEGRVLRACLAPDASPLSPRHTTEEQGARSARRASRECLQQPLFIVAAPRSGSSLLFETLAASGELATVGGEAHWLVEGIDELCPGSPGIDSNRLLAEQATAEVGARIKGEILERLVDRRGAPVSDGRLLRFLEKTPKNALRVPFFDRLFPDACFVFLWREPRGNLGSIIDAWQAGTWRTYPRLAGFDPPWSLLLPPGWPALRGRPLEEIAAFQWQTTNRLVMQDLAALAPGRWTSVEYSQFIAEPQATVQRLCRFAGIDYDGGLAERLSQPLPPAKHTLTPADPGKWRKHAAAIERVLPSLEATWRELAALAPGP
jgi:hypothetical protein